VGRLWAWCFQIWKEFCCGSHTTHVTITDDTHATVLQNLKQHSRKGDQETWQLESCSQAQSKMTKLEIKPFTLQYRPGLQWLLSVQKHEETLPWTLVQKQLWTLTGLYDSGLKTKKKNFNSSGISFVPQEGYQTHGGLYWETMQTYLFYLKYFMARQIIYLASVLYCTHALWRDRWAMQLRWDVFSHSQINTIIITWALTSTSSPPPCSFHLWTIWSFMWIMYCFYNASADVSCALTGLQCGFECYKLLTVLLLLPTRSQSGALAARCKVVALAPPAIFTYFTFTITSITHNIHILHFYNNFNNNQILHKPNHFC